MRSARSSTRAAETAGRHIEPFAREGHADHTPIPAPSGRATPKPVGVKLQVISKRRPSPDPNRPPTIQRSFVSSHCPASNQLPKATLPPPYSTTSPDLTGQTGRTASRSASGTSSGVGNWLGVSGIHDTYDVGIGPGGCPCDPTPGRITHSLPRPRIAQKTSSGDVTARHLSHRLVGRSCEIGFGCPQERDGQQGDAHTSSVIGTRPDAHDASTRPANSKFSSSGRKHRQ